MLSDAVAILPVFKPFKAFLFFSYIIYHLCFKNALKRIFRKNNTFFSVSAKKKDWVGNTATSLLLVSMRILSCR